MISVLCTKWGTKYDSDYVNRLHSMVCRHLSLDFKFYCHTEDSQGLDKDIITIPIDDDLEGWWNKMSYFKFDLGQCISFDLDLIIHGNIDNLITSDFHMIKCYWKDKSKYGVDISDRNQGCDMRDILCNSSVMSWVNREDVWENFNKRRKWYLYKYITDDRYMHWENVKYNEYPPGIFYSYTQGSDFDLDNEPCKFRPDHSVCIFHQDPKQHTLTDSWIKEHWK